MSKTNEKERFSFSYQIETKEQLQVLAEKDKRKLPNYIRMVLDAHIKTIIKKKRS